MKKNSKIVITVIIVCLLIPLFWAIGYVIFKPQEISYRIASFKNLPGWKEADFQKSLATFQRSCQTFLRMQPEDLVGSQQISMKAKEWLPICHAAQALDSKSKSQKASQQFFEKWFVPISWYDKKQLTGLFTGYYLPYFPGSLTKTETYPVPIYGLPSNLVTINLEDFDPALAPRVLVGRLENNKVLPYYSREQINRGMLKDKAPVLVWVKSHIDRLFLEIQGSGTIELEDGRLINLNYAGENGAPYFAVGRVLVEKGVMTKETASMQGIRAYLEAHPDDILPVLNKNKSFVFFRTLNQATALGAQGVELTPGYSLAVDRRWVPLGMPIWLDTTRPGLKTESPQKLQRLMIAQDTGGAIRGPVRGDVFWGGGDKATYIAGKMKNKGQYWLLVPRSMLPQLPKHYSQK